MVHVGYAPIFQNPGHRLPDREVYEQELRLAELAVSLGFESVWSVEHHFTDYTMCPNVLQFLAYMAGRHSNIQVGSMVVVLPWHDPLRVAEDIVMLDNLSGGRLILGIGRGLGLVEYEGFRLDMDDSRARFIECARMILEGIERGYVEAHGTYVDQPRRDIRPEPFRSFRGRTFAAAVSPDSMPVMAKVGVGLLVIPQKPWKDVAHDFEVYHQVWSEVNPGTEPPHPMVGGFCFVDRDAATAEDMGRKYCREYYYSVIKHYQMNEQHFASKKSYEFYNQISKHINRLGIEAAADGFAGLMPWGTPDQVLEKLSAIRAIVEMDGLMGHFSYAGMPYDLAERSMRLFAAEVMPVLKQWGAEQRSASTAQDAAAAPGSVTPR
jgi:alkanesulfonate monooxygenase SsuD/methylene tetrahydromethanopterin reductase-like flavin-dependent oxidoreductase (luciferase family)